MDNILMVGGSILAGFIIGHYLMPNRKMLEHIFNYGYNTGLIDGARDTSGVYKIILAKKFGEQQAHNIEREAFNEKDHPYGKLVLVKGGKDGK